MKTNIVQLHQTKRLEFTVTMTERTDGLWDGRVMSRMYGGPHAGEEMLAMEIEAAPNAFQLHEEFAKWHLEIARESRELLDNVVIDQYAKETGLSKAEVTRRMRLDAEPTREAEPLGSGETDE